MRGQAITIQLVTATGCANCAKTQRAVADVVTAFQGEYPIELEEVNLTEHPELLTQHDIWGTPALIINDELAFVGTVNDQQLREKLTAVAAGR